MGRNWKRKGTGRPSVNGNSENGELKPISLKRSRRRVTGTDKPFKVAETFPDYRIEVRRIDSKNGTPPKYERLVRCQHNGREAYSPKALRPENSSKLEKAVEKDCLTVHSRNKSTPKYSSRKIPTLNWTVCRIKGPKGRMKGHPRHYFQRKHDKESSVHTSIGSSSINSVVIPPSNMMDENTIRLKVGTDTGRESVEYLSHKVLDYNNSPNCVGEDIEFSVNESHGNSNSGIGSQNQCSNVLVRELPQYPLVANLINHSQDVQQGLQSKIDLQQVGKSDMVVENRNNCISVSSDAYLSYQMSNDNKTGKLRHFHGNKNEDCSTFDGQQSVCSFSSTDCPGPLSTIRERSLQPRQFENVSSIVLYSSGSKSTCKTKDYSDAECSGPYVATQQVDAKVCKSLSIFGPGNTSSISIEHPKMGPSIFGSNFSVSSTNGSWHSKKKCSEKTEEPSSDLMKNSEYKIPGYSRKFCFTGRHMKTSPTRHKNDCRIQKYCKPGFSSSESAKSGVPSYRCNSPPFQYLYMKQMNQDVEFVSTMVLVQMNEKKLNGQ